jgi:hypothetical protein
MSNTMTQATDKDIREIKSAIEGLGKGTEANTKAIEGIAKGTEANTKAIEGIGKDTEANTKAIEGLGKGTEANTKAIADLTISVNVLKEEMRLGFSDVKGDLKLIDFRLKVLETTAQKLPDLAEKVGELKNWKQVAIVVFTASVSGTIAWFLHSGKV